MHFLAPLAFAFAAAIPVVIVFYLLKRKRVVKLVSSTLLWQKFLAETQASAPFQKLRKNWLLILQIILLTLAVLALARPYFSTEAKPAQRRVVILDASASMQATDEAPSRFEQARAEALKWVDSLKDTDEMVIVLAGADDRGQTVRHQREGGLAPRAASLRLLGWARRAWCPRSGWRSRSCATSTRRPARRSTSSATAPCRS